MTAKQAIEESIARNRIITLEWTSERANELIRAADDSVDTGGEVEYWGTTGDGLDWRVHLSRSASEARHGR